MTVAVSVQPTQYLNIMNAIHDVARNQSGLTFAGSKMWEVPFGSEIESVGVPFLSVSAGDLDSWGVGGERTEDMRLIGAIEPIWCAVVGAIFPYSMANPNHQTAASALVSLITGFTANFDLEGTTYECAIVPGKDNTGLTYWDIDGTLYRVAKVTVRAYEDPLMIQYL